MFTIMVEAGFSATHGVVLPDGTLEPSHSHDWHVRAFFTRAELDDNRMVMDFREAQEGLRAVLAPLDHSDLNKVESMAALNPTAETVAGRIFAGIKSRGLLAIRRVEVTEAPGCVAIFEESPGEDCTD